MNNKNRAPVRLAIGGESWNGWTFGPYGRAREWRINAPGGCSYTVNELEDLRGLYLNIDYLQVRIRKIELELTEARKNEAFYRRQVITEAKLGLALLVQDIYIDRVN